MRFINIRFYDFCLFSLIYRYVCFLGFSLFIVLYYIFLYIYLYFFLLFFWLVTATLNRVTWNHGAI